MTQKYVTVEVHPHQRPLAAAIGLTRCNDRLHHGTPNRVAKFTLLSRAGIIPMFRRGGYSRHYFKWRKLDYLRLHEACRLAESLLLQ